MTTTLNYEATRQTIEEVNPTTGRVTRKTFWTVRDENGNVIGRSPRKWEAEQEAEANSAQ